MAFDATDAEFERRALAYEMGGEDDGDRAWNAFHDAAEAGIRSLGFGVTLDEDEDLAGYSLDGAYEAFERGTSIEDYLASVARARMDLPPEPDEDDLPPLGFNPHSGAEYDGLD